MEEQIQRKGWFARNWKWAVPTGGCLLIIVLFVSFAGTLIWGITSMMLDSQAYVDTMEKAKTNTVVIERIGEPIETNGIIKGNINYTNGYGHAELTIPIKGPKGEATIRVEGGGVEENWTYQTMDVYIYESRETINLLDNNISLPILD